VSTYNPNAQPQKQTVVALFASRRDADQSVTRLLDVGFASEDIGFLEPADVRHAKKRARRRLDWNLVGAILGAVAGGSMGAFVVGLPGVVGTVVAAVTGIALGAYAGVVVGGFFGGDAGAEEDPYYLQALQAGRILVAAQVSDGEGEVKAAVALQQGNALEVSSLWTGRLRSKLHHPAVEAEVKAA
jgi:hypothetical protein